MAKQISVTMDQAKEALLAYLEQVRPDLKVKAIKNVRKTIESKPRIIIDYDE